MGALDGRVAIITGAGRGIGRAYALAFASEGARLVLNSLEPSSDGAPGTSSAHAVAAEIRDTGASGRRTVRTCTPR
jgi:NAD(P)-dependent dehydrogenase (short-subunit alcohol dehydrogenase family)